MDPNRMDEEEMQLWLKQKISFKNIQNRIYLIPIFTFILIAFIGAVGTCSSNCPEQGLLTLIFICGRWMIYVYFRSLPSCSIPKSTHDIINKGSKTWTVFSCVIIYIAAIIQRYLGGYALSICIAFKSQTECTFWFRFLKMRWLILCLFLKSDHVESPSDSKQFSKISIMMWECFWASLPPSMWKGLKDSNQVSFLMTLRMGFEKGPDPQDFWFDTKLVYKYV